MDREYTTSEVLAQLIAGVSTTLVSVIHTLEKHGTLPPGAALADLEKAADQLGKSGDHEIMHQVVAGTVAALRTIEA